MSLAVLIAETTFLEFPLPERTIKRSFLLASVFIWYENIFSNPISFPKHVSTAGLDVRAFTFNPGTLASEPQLPVP